jgi:hypothetical protein
VVTTFLGNNASSCIYKRQELYQIFSLKNCAEDGLYPDKEPEPGGQDCQVARRSLLPCCGSGFNWDSATGTETTGTEELELFALAEPKPE